MRRCWKDWRGLKWDDFLLFFHSSFFFFFRCFFFFFSFFFLKNETVSQRLAGSC